MNPLYELVTITPQFDFNQLEDEKEYDYKYKFFRGITFGRSSGKNIKLTKELITEIYLPHTEEKKVNEETEVNIQLPKDIYFGHFLSWYKSKQVVNFFDECNNRYIISEYLKEYELPNDNSLNDNIIKEYFDNYKSRYFLRSDDDFFALNENEFSDAIKDICDKLRLSVSPPSSQVSKEEEICKCSLDVNRIKDNVCNRCNKAVSSSVEVSKKPLSEYILDIQVDVEKEIKQQCKACNCDDKQTDKIMQNVTTVLEFALIKLIKHYPVPLPAIEVSDEEIDTFCDDTIYDIIDTNGFGQNEKNGEIYPTVSTATDIIKIELKKFLNDKLKGGNKK